jgi:hypothetical protein
MNIFVLDQDPVVSAKSLCDKHVVKMTLETAQILSTVHWILDGHGPYKPTHTKHPCVVWAAKTNANYIWLARHGLAIAEEYTERYKKTHKSHSVLRWANSHLPANIINGSLTPFAIAINKEKYSHLICSDPVLSYRAFYKADKSSFATWKNNKPSWW